MFLMDAWIFQISVRVFCRKRLQTPSPCMGANRRGPKGGVVEKSHAWMAGVWFQPGVSPESMWSQCGFGPPYAAFLSDGFCFGWAGWVRIGID